jgi:hypothetical protein
MKRNVGKFQSKTDILSNFLLLVLPNDMWATEHSVITNRYSSNFENDGRYKPRQVICWDNRKCWLQSHTSWRIHIRLIFKRCSENTRISETVITGALPNVKNGPTLFHGFLTRFVSSQTKYLLRLGYSCFPCQCLKPRRTRTTKLRN